MEELAREIFSTTPQTRTRPAGKRYWVMALGPKSARWEEFFHRGIAATSFTDQVSGDLRRYKRRRDLTSAGLGPHYSKACHEFSRVMKPGDVIFVKSGVSAVLGHGTVSSDYRFEDGGHAFPHVRDVEWLIASSRASFSQRKGDWQDPHRQDGRSGADRRVRWAAGAVQFHQSYGYEDFVRGYRPTEEGGFVLRDGPSLRLRVRERFNALNRLVADNRDLGRGYVEHSEETRRPRGMIDLATTVRRALRARARVAVRYEDLTTDVLQNRLVKTTMRRSAQESARQPEGTARGRLGRVGPRGGPGRRPNPAGLQEKLRGSKSSGFTMLALLPVARMTKRPLRWAYLTTESLLWRYATAP